MFLDSVDRSEINVTVGGEECNAIITGAQAADTVSLAFLYNNFDLFPIYCLNSTHVLYQGIL